MSKSTSFQERFLAKLIQDYNGSFDHSGINGKRVAERLAELSNIGLTDEGGCNRIAFSKEERQVKELVKIWMKEAGLVVTEDGAGNVFGRYKGIQDKPAVLSGSHVDSVPTGGHFDGPLGVLAALEVAAAWKDTGYQPDKPYEVVIFTDEEGARFNGGLLGSQAMVGVLDSDKLRQLQDFNGDSFEEVIGRDGLTLDGFVSAKRNLSDIAAFVEVHIEQGKRLEKEELPVGIVTGIAGPTWLNISFKGEAGHAGNTPMNDRKDALIAASEFIASVKDFPPTVSSSAVATVGKVEVFPNGVNVIPGEVKLTVDIRDIQAEPKNEVVRLVTEAAKQKAAKYEIDVEIKETLSVLPVVVSDEMRAKAAFAVEKVLEVNPYYLPSGAGHDAMFVGRYVPMAMLFTQSKEGISHNPKEWSSLGDCIQTIHVLKNVIEQLCDENGGE
ncbi:Zn-dependent hydrolase [Halalkalibacter kiskunsagensis]|uniref:Zn-dependent hydrolase n=1 Tax=Halalkalibacter kiskunsagensis TaxID=1548599 RepID=A0ABV6KA56_9BACI